jgi:hypothetical protein
MPITDFGDDIKVHEIEECVSQEIFEELRRVIRYYPDYIPELIYVEDDEIVDEETGISIQLVKESLLSDEHVQTINNYLKENNCYLCKIKFFFNKTKCNTLWVFSKE